MCVENNLHSGTVNSLIQCHTVGKWQRHYLNSDLLLPSPLKIFLLPHAVSLPFPLQLLQDGSKNLFESFSHFPPRALFFFEWFFKKPNRKGQWVSKCTIVAFVQYNRLYIALSSPYKVGHRRFVFKKLALYFSLFFFFLLPTQFYLGDKQCYFHSLHLSPTLNVFY